jgi:hypothetical protein
MRSGSEPLHSELWSAGGESDLGLAHRAVAASIATAGLQIDHAVELRAAASPALLVRVSSPAAAAEGYHSTALVTGWASTLIVAMILIMMSFCRRQRCEVECKTPCACARWARSVRAAARYCCCCCCGLCDYCTATADGAGAAAETEIILVTAGPSTADAGEEGGVEVLVAEPANEAENTAQEGRVILSVAQAAPPPDNNVSASVVYLSGGGR